MPDDLPVRYYNSGPKKSRFKPGDVIFSYTERSVRKLFRMVIDTDHGGDQYHAFRLDENGEKAGNAYLLSPAQSKCFHKDDLLTNLLGKQVGEVDHV